MSQRQESDHDAEHGGGDTVPFRGMVEHNENSGDEIEQSDDGIVAFNEESFSQGNVGANSTTQIENQIVVE